ncbi:MAG: histidine--tRNA ligase [Candidatus Moraniibacteriota bacterium]
MGRRKLRQRQAEEIVKRRQKEHINLQTLRGMRDIFGVEAGEWIRVRDIITAVAHIFDFGYIETPILENINLYIRGGSDDSISIVNKEMYSFETKGGDKVCLRPELTPSIVRAYLEDGMQSWRHPIKLYTIGSIFRYERPQEGRYREAHQINFEMIGVDAPIAEAQLIQVAFYILKKLGLENIIVEVNSLGCRDCQREFQKQLKRYIIRVKPKLCAECMKRTKKNPLRIFDCKDEKCQAALKDAPLIVDNLCKACNKHFKEVLEYLDSLKIPYRLNVRLVRGLDYYTHTVFEFFREGDETRRQSALGGGGRYDHLVEEFGGKFTPAVGFGFGMDRIVAELLKRKKRKNEKPLVFLAQLGDKSRHQALKLFEDLWDAGFPVKESFTKTSLRTQLRVAKQEKARWVLVLGYKEAIEENVIVRDQVSGIQQIVSQSDLVEFLRKQKLNS